MALPLVALHVFTKRMPGDGDGENTVAIVSRFSLSGSIKENVPTRSSHSSSFSLIWMLMVFLLRALSFLLFLPPWCTRKSDFPLSIRLCSCFCIPPFLPTLFVSSVVQVSSPGGCNLWPFVWSTRKPPALLMKYIFYCLRFQTKCKLITFALC